ncbi:mechanosensitive ion channel family protein [Chitinophaga japonensis]|nr:mechanosensitive ion channel domain-containing protein [Chitinophaga japonensis]
MLTDQATYNRKRFRNQIFIFVIKLLVYLGLTYFSFSQRDLFSKYHWLERATNALSLFLGANLLISVGWIVTIFWYLQKHRLQKLTRDNFVLGINRITSVLNTVFLLVAMLIFFGQKLSELFFSLSIAAAALALLSKDYITNMINGLIIMFSDQLSLGDQIKVNEYRGKVLDITLVNVVLQNEDDDIVLIPNSVIFSSMVINQSKQNIKKLTIEFELDLKHHISPEIIEKELKTVLLPFSSNITDSSFSLKILEIKKDAVHYKIQFLMPRPDKETERKIKRLLNSTILSFSGREVNTHQDAD